jgi:hypothetical protein
MEDHRPSSATRERRLDPWLVAIVLLTAIGGALVVSRARDWSVMPDELIYTEFARSIVHSVLPIPAVQGHAVTVLQVLYPTLLAPLLAIMSMPTAYPWIAVMNACLMASAAIPAYLLAHYTTESRAAARWVALSCAITPWLLFAAKVLPDAAAYAACTWALYAIVRTAGARNRVLRADLLTLLAIFVAYLVRNQFLILLGIWAGTVVLAKVAAVLGSDGPRALPRALLKLLRERPLPIFTLVFAFLMVKFQPAWILGFYAPVGTVSNEVLPGESLPRELLNHANAIGIGVAALPLVLGLPWLLTALTRIGRRREVDTAILIVLASAVVIYVGSNFDMRFDPTERVIERYIFYLAPLWLTAMAAFFARPPKNLIAFALPALLGVLLLIATKPFGLDAELNRAINRAFSPTQLVLIEWQKVAGALHTSISGMIVVVSLIVCVFCWWAIDRARVSIARDACFSLLAVILLTGTIAIVPQSIREDHETAVRAFGPRTSDQKRWIELASDRQKYAVVYSRWSLYDGRLGDIARERKEFWRDAAFWNRGLSATYTPDRVIGGSTTPVPGVAYPLKIDWTSGRLTRGPGESAPNLLLSASDPRFAPQATAPVTRTKNFVLYPVAQKVQAAWYLRNLTASGWVPPNGATLRIWAPRGASGPTRMQVTLRVTTTNVRRPAAPLLPPAETPIRVKTVKRQTTYSWPISISPGQHVDFRLARGRANAHVDRVAVTPLQRASGLGR